MFLRIVVPSLLGNNPSIFNFWSSMMGWPRCDWIKTLWLLLESNSLDHSFTKNTKMWLFVAAE